MPHRIVIADDHPLFRDALRLAVQDALSDARIDDAGSLKEAVEVLSSGDDIDLILLDLKMPGVQGFSGLVLIRSQFPLVPVVVVSGTEDHSVVRRAISLGALGFIPKSASVAQMQQAVNSVLEGNVWLPDGIDLETQGSTELDELAQRLKTLTPQQTRVLMMLREGLLNKQIAYELSVSEATVKAHVSAILQKLRVDSRTQAVIAASRIDGDTIEAGQAGLTN